MSQSADDLIPLLLELQSQVLGQQDLLEHLQRENAALKAEIAVTKAQSESLLQAREAALAAAEVAQGQSKALEEEISRIHASKAWRITAPLRRLRAGLSRWT